MAEVIKKATRDGYGNALVELAEKYDNLIVMDADLAAATKTGVFKKAYPDQFFDAGIAECNLMGRCGRPCHNGLFGFRFFLRHVCGGPRV